MAASPARGLADCFALFRMALLLFVITIKMATIDIIILAMIGVGVIMGLMKGFVKQMASIVGLIAGLLMARALFGIVAERLAPVLGTSTTVAQVLAFIWGSCFRFCVRRLLFYKSIGCCAPGMAEPLVRGTVCSIEVYDTDRVSYSCDRIYLPTID